MKKSVGVLLVLSLLVFSMLFVSASWYPDFWGKITGNVVDENYFLEQQLRGPALYADADADCQSRGMRLPTWQEASWEYNDEVLPEANGTNRIWTSAYCYSGRYSGAYAGLRERVETGVDTGASNYQWNCLNAGSTAVYQCVLNTSSTPVQNQTNVTCTDTDGGLNYYVKGNISGYNSTNGGTYFNYQDYCATPSNVTYLDEFSCSNNRYQWSRVTCPSGVCSDGACVNVTAPSNQTCIDSDGGLNYYVKGNLTTSVVPGTNFEDYCLHNNLIERHCLSSDPNNFTVNYSCPNGCSNGACVNVTQNQTNLTCNGQTNQGQQCIEIISPKNGEKLVNGTIYNITWKQFNTDTINIYLTSSPYFSTRTYIASVLKTNSSQIYQSYLWDINIMGTDQTEGYVIGIHAYPATSVYSNGTFGIYPYIFHEPSCNDSDGGLNYYVKGNTFGNSQDGSNWSKTDYCEESIVLEYDCNNNMPGDGGSFVCPNGCIDGSCITSCSPVGNRFRENNQSYYCSANGSNILQQTVESDCENNYECRSNFCSDGKCISNPSQTSGLIVKIWCKVSTLFSGEEAYESCLAQY